METQLPARRALGLLADLRARLDVIVHRLAEPRLEVGDVVRVEADAVADARQVAEEDAVVVVVFDAGRVAPVRHRVRHR